MADYPYHIVQRGNNRQVVFNDNQDREFYLARVFRYLEESNCGIYAYCLMDNHVHMLVNPKGGTALAKFMLKTSLTYTQYFNRKYKRSGRLWECRFFSSLVSDEKYLHAVRHYIEQNPVRAGVVTEANLYPWSSCRLGRNLEYKIVSPRAIDEQDKMAFAGRSGSEGRQDGKDIEFIRIQTSRGAANRADAIYNKFLSGSRPHLAWKPARKA